MVNIGRCFTRLTISTGFVDDAIVVLENTSCHIEQGVSPREAALKGAGEVGFTILTMSLSLIAMFIPILLMGEVRRWTSFPGICGHSLSCRNGFAARLADHHTHALRHLAKAGRNLVTWSALLFDGTVNQALLDFEMHRLRQPLISVFCHP